MKVSLLYCDGCPNWQIMDDRWDEAPNCLGGVDVVVERGLRCRPHSTGDGRAGSPTVEQLAAVLP